MTRSVAPWNWPTSSCCAEAQSRIAFSTQGDGSPLAGTAISACAELAMAWMSPSAATMLLMGPLASFNVFSRRVASSISFVTAGPSSSQESTSTFTAAKPQSIVKCRDGRCVSIQLLRDLFTMTTLDEGSVSQMKGNVALSVSIRSRMTVSRLLSTTCKSALQKFATTVHLSIRCGTTPPSAEASIFGFFFWQKKTPQSESLTRFSPPWHAFLGSSSRVARLCVFSSWSRAQVGDAG